MNAVTAGITSRNYNVCPTCHQMDQSGCRRKTDRTNCTAVNAPKKKPFGLKLCVSSLGNDSQVINLRLNNLTDDVSYLALGVIVGFVYSGNQSL